MDTYPLKEQVSRLIQYINELSQLRQKPITSFRNYEEVLWLQKDKSTSHCDLSLKLISFIIDFTFHIELFLSLLRKSHSTGFHR